MNNSYNYPAVSVIIPLYNAEKYIAECLDSILAQTFQNFEVIVVDDCSTDNSVTIVESYAAKFGGRLKLSRTQKNSGGGGVPRNKGLSLSRGGYLSFIDADDTITPTALEELYTVAKNFDADVVACEKYYEVPEKFCYNAEFRAQLKPSSYKKGNFVDKPTLLDFDVAARVEDIINGRFLWNLWSKLIRRDLVLENELKFMNYVRADDFTFTICSLCTAKKIVRVPNVVNYYRFVENSVSHVRREPFEHFAKQVQSWVIGFKYLDEFLSEREFFRQNLGLKYLVLERHLSEMVGYVIQLYTQIPAPAFDKILRKEFRIENCNALAAFIFNVMNIQRLQSF